MYERNLHIEIEATNRCNTRCLSCPHEMLSRPIGVMNLDTYQAVMDKVMAYCTTFSVEYAGMGEPLLNPHIVDFVAYVSGRGTTNITTNASLLTKQTVVRLIEAGLTGMTISFSGDTPELYGLMIGGLSFKRAEENIRQAIELCEETNTHVAANVCVTVNNQPRLVAIKDRLNKIGINEIFFSKCHSRGGYLKDKTVCDTPMPPRDLHRCDIFTTTLFIAWTGEVLSCCQDLAGENVLGSLKTESLEAILEKKSSISVQGVNFSICHYCNDLYRFMGDQTIDSRSIADWVYDLYTCETSTDKPPLNPLSEWLITLYAQEGKSHEVVKTLWAQNQKLSRQVYQLTQAINALEDNNEI